MIRKVKDGYIVSVEIDGVDYGYSCSSLINAELQEQSLQLARQITLKHKRWWRLGSMKGGRMVTNITYLAAKHEYRVRVKNNKDKVVFAKCFSIRKYGNRKAWLKAKQAIIDHYDIPFNTTHYDRVMRWEPKLSDATAERITAELSRKRSC